MLPQSAQLGESALTLNETLVAAPNDAVATPVPCPLLFPFPFMTGSGMAAAGATGAAGSMGAAGAWAMAPAPGSEWASPAPLGSFVSLAGAPSGA